MFFPWKSGTSSGPTNSGAEGRLRHHVLRLRLDTLNCRLGDLGDPVFRELVGFQYRLGRIDVRFGIVLGDAKHAQGRPCDTAEHGCSGDAALLRRSVQRHDNNDARVCDRREADERRVVQIDPGALLEDLGRTRFTAGGVSRDGRTPAGSSRTTSSMIWRIVIVVSERSVRIGCFFSTATSMKRPSPKGRRMDATRRGWTK